MAFLGNLASWAGTANDTLNPLFKIGEHGISEGLNRGPAGGSGSMPGGIAGLQAALAANKGQATTTQQPTPPTINATGTAGGGGAAAPAFNAALYNAQYQANKGNLQSQLNTLGPAQQNAQYRAMNSYQSNMNNLDTQNAQGQRNLTAAQGQVDQSKAQSLQQLRDMVASQYDSYMRQPGVSDSSAGGMITKALGSSASKNRYGVLQNATDQTQAIGNQQQDLATSYDSQRQGLDQWKADTLNDIAMKFLQARQTIEQQLVGADATHAQGLAQQNAALTQEAVAALGRLQSLYATQSQQLSGQYQNVAAPSVDLGSMSQYSVKPIDAGTLQGIRQGVAQQPSAAPDTIAPIFKRQDDQFNF